MPRYLESNTVYEIVFRAKDSLPLVALETMKLIISSVLARVNRDFKVIICHDIWNGSHCHIIVICLDVESLTKFYGEVQKQLTDAIKRLLGLPKLNIWEGETAVTKIGDLEAAQREIAYIYSNPGKDHLVERIEDFVGASSWQAYLTCPDTLNAHHSEWFPWIRQTTIPRLSSSSISREEDLSVTEILRVSNEEGHELVRQPNAWMKCFGITKDEEVMEINKRIKAKLRQMEADARKKRQRENKSILGAERLRNQPLMKPHTPKKRGRKILIIATDKEVIVEHNLRAKAFRKTYKNCHARWRRGELNIEWPPEGFKPQLPPRMSLVTF